MSGSAITLRKMNKGMSIQMIVIVFIFVIVLLIALIFLMLGKQYLNQITDQIFNVFGKKT